MKQPQAFSQRAGAMGAHVCSCYHLIGPVDKSYRWRGSHVMVSQME
jgi:hypothetical protein